MKDDVLVNSSEACRLLGDVSAMYLTRRIESDPTFPRPIQPTPHSHRFWWRSELVEWANQYRKSA